MFCPKCQSSEVIPFVYGDPNWEAVELSRDGKIILGGSTASLASPHYRCKKCSHEWRDK